MIRIEPAAIPPRRWALYGPPGCGKSTFAARLRAPLLVIDADGRFSEVCGLAGGDVFGLSADSGDLRDPEKIADLLHAQGAELGKVRTIVVDSLTPIIAPLVSAAILENDRGEHKNKMQAWKGKALAMKVLADAVTAPGCDVLLIWHESEGRNAQGDAQTTQTLPPTERARLLRSLNLTLRMVTDAGGRRGLQVAWARRGRAGAAVGTLWDDSGNWAGMPERLELAVYGGLTPAEQKQLEEDPPHFPGREAAIAWGFEHAGGAFREIAHAGNAYDVIRRGDELNPPPATARAMWAAWKLDVKRRAAERAGSEETPATGGQEGANGPTSPAVGV